MEPSAMRTTVLIVCLTVGIPLVLYVALLTLMVVAPGLQAHAIYLHKVTLTWFNDLNVPEQFGFAHHQVTPFYISTPDGGRLHAWHVLPLGAYAAHHDELLSAHASSKRLPAGRVEAFEDTVNFRILKQNPQAKLVLYFHGTSGTLASGWRPASYRALYAADPANTHILTFDYRGYGGSTGHPSEEGLIADALAVATWAVRTAGVSPDRIVVFGQSLGSAVAVALVNELAKTEPAVHFAGLVVTASFADVAQLTATYRIGGFVPVLSPVARVGPLFRFFTGRLQSRWDNAARLAEFVGNAESYHITMIHAEDDSDILAEHSKQLFRRAVAAAEARKDGDEDVIDARIRERTKLHGEGGSTVSWQTAKGEIRLVLLKYGVHDKIMSYPVTSLAVMRAFEVRQ